MFGLTKHFYKHGSTLYPTKVNGIETKYIYTG